MKGIYWVVFAIMLALSAAPALAQEKYALVIGNAAYRFGPLKNPVNDARSIANTLRLQQLGFKVTEFHNRSRKQMTKVIREFGQSIKPGSVAVVYFSGHGAQYQGENYLFPVDFDTQFEDDLPTEAISTGFVMDKLRNNFNGLNIVILDACRDNPLQKKYKNSAKGLARINNAPPNTYTIFATGPGQVASDNPHGKNGLFTKHLVEYMKEPGLSLGDMVLETRKEVMRASSNKQVPYDSGSLTQRFCFAGCRTNSQVSTLAVASAPPATRPSNNTHSHNGRSHTHPLPTQGVNHQHGGASQPAPRPVTPAVVSRPTPPTRNYREPDMVFIKGGTFMMGSPANEARRDDGERQHSVTVGNFHLGKTEVTVGEFRRFVQAANYRTEAERSAKGCRVYLDGKWQDGVDNDWQRPGFSQSDKHPVVCVSQTDALAYANWLSKQTGKRYGLPTEAQWEYAARAAAQTAYPWGNQIGKNQANCDGCGSQWDDKSTAPVGRFSVNRFGLHDMIGNALEWTCSAYEENYNGSEQRCAPTSDARPRVLRGGSWYDTPGFVRSAYRDWITATYRGNGVGFRLSRTP